MPSKSGRKSQANSPKPMTRPTSPQGRPLSLQFCSNTDTDTVSTSTDAAKNEIEPKPPSPVNFDFKTNGNATPASTSIELSVPKRLSIDSKRVTSPHIKDLIHSLKMNENVASVEQAESGKSEEVLEQNQTDIKLTEEQDIKNTPTQQDIAQLQKENAISFQQALNTLLEHYLPAPLLLPHPGITTDGISPVPTILEIEVRHATAQAARNVYHAHISNDEKRKEFDFEYARIEKEWFGRGSRVANLMRKLARNAKAKGKQCESGVGADLDIGLGRGAGDELGP